MNWLRGTKGTLLVAAMAMAGTTCTLSLDHSATQCNNDDDCGKLNGHHPFCDQKKGVCVSSGFQPDMCVFTDPSKGKVPTLETDFLNACTLNAMLPGPADLPDGCGTFTMPVDDGGMLKTPPAPTTTTPTLPLAPTMLCTDLVPAGTQILYLTGSSNFPPLLQELSQVIVKSIGIVPVFRTTTSCLGVRALNPASATYNTDKYIKDPVNAMDPYPSWAQIFLGDGTAVNCLLGSKTLIDIGESEIAQDTCGPPANPSDSVLEIPGPILPIIFIVPKVSNQKLISVAAAHQIFGTGGNVPPWVTADNLYIRGQGTATLRLVGTEIGLMPNQFWGTDQGTASNMAANLALLTGQDAANSALGIIGTDFYDQPLNRGRLKALGFQASGQTCAYLPDSSLTARDKINVRDGHYPLWGRIHFFAARSNGMLVSPAAAAFVPLFTAATLDPDVLAALIKAGFVPPCAMMVTRNSELGHFTYDDPPPVSCGCAFDAQVLAPPRSECTPCQMNSECPSTRPSCNYGFCEQEPS